MNKTDGKSPRETEQEDGIQAQVAQGWITKINSGSRIRESAYWALNSEGVV